MVTGSTRGAPVHPLALAGIVIAVVAGLLGLYGAMYAEKHIAGSPLREARGASSGAPRPESLPARKLTEGEKAVFEVMDDGPGFPAEFDPCASANTGLELVENISRWDLNGTTQYDNTARGGRVAIVFPV